MPGAFRRAVAGAGDFLGRLGDAVAGVDRDAAYRQGMLEGYEVEDASLQPAHTRAQTDAAMELARQRREAARIAEIERANRERIQSMENNLIASTATMPLGAIIAGGMGSDFSSAMQGRNYGQEYEHRDRVATPAGGMLGDDIVTEDARVAAMEALSPSSAIAARRPGTGASASEPVVLVETPEGARYVPRSQAAGQPPAPRPAATSSGTPTAQQRNIEDLIGRGVPENLATAIVYRLITDPQEAKLRMVDAMVRSGFYSPETAQAMADEVVGGIYGDIEQGLLAPPVVPPRRAAPTPEAAGLGDQMLGGPAPGAPGSIPRVNTPEEAAALPSGTIFIAPDGSRKVKP